ncbi:MAG: type II toxin-antitoxin system RelE/ParE family toxin [Flavobacteriales bacterium]|nr:type II toxin-antitoxin system RelE/ParE family toxin [Flavobacteriales bacterium]
MFSKKGHFEISLPADEDLEEIFIYTEEEFGTDQAVEYLTELDTVFYQLVGNPELGRERNEIKKGLRSFPSGSHVVFYRILADHVRIVRVLHGSRDLPRHF